MLLLLDPGDDDVKLSKCAKNRIDLLSQADKKKLISSTKVLAECEAITMERAKVIIRWAKRSHSY